MASDPSAHPPDPPAIDRYLGAARDRLDRVEPDQLASEVAAGALVVDIRPEGNRRTEGVLPGAVVIERIHLEWRLDPSSPDRIPEAIEDRRVIVFCNEGYASSLAAAALRDVGVPRATDLVGGFRAWAATVAPTLVDEPEPVAGANRDGSGAGEA